MYLHHSLTNYQMQNSEPCLFSPHFVQRQKFSKALLRRAAKKILQGFLKKKNIWA